jgi:hypothetical protein
MAISAAVLSCASIAVAVLHVPAVRSDVPVVARPSGPEIRVLGASIGNLPAGAVAQALGRLKTVDSVAWSRALIRRDGATAGRPDSLFLPVRTMAEAFAICARLADQPYACKPLVAVSTQLLSLEGDIVGAAGLTAYGLEPYRPTVGMWTKVI